MTLRPRSMTIWRSTTRSRSPSNGPKPPRTSSPGNAARWTNSMKFAETGRKCQIQNTSDPRIFEL
jgi:hypothetical protein